MLAIKENEKVVLLEMSLLIVFKNDRYLRTTLNKYMEKRIY